MNWTKDLSDARGLWTTSEGWRVYAMADGSFRVYDPRGGYRTGDTAEVCMEYADGEQASC